VQPTSQIYTMAVQMDDQFRHLIIDNMGWWTVSTEPIYANLIQKNVLIDGQ